MVHCESQICKNLDFKSHIPITHLIGTTPLPIPPTPPPPSHRITFAWIVNSPSQMKQRIMSQHRVPQTSNGTKRKANNLAKMVKSSLRLDVLYPVPHAKGTKVMREVTVCAVWRWSPRSPLFFTCRDLLLDGMWFSEIPALNRVTSHTVH